MPIGAAVFWGYIGLLLVGGVIGFVKSASKASLIASTIIAAGLVAAYFAKLGPVALAGILGLLGVYFGYKFVKSRKIMPGAIFCVLSFAAAGIVYLTGAR